MSFLVTAMSDSSWYVREINSLCFWTRSLSVSIHTVPLPPTRLVEHE